MHKLLEGKTALVTGGARGIGRAIALAYAHQGARVAVCDVDDVAGQQTEAMLKQYHADCFYMHTDAGDEADIAKLCQAVDTAFGGLDTLCNNVGINLHAPVYDIKDEHHKRVWDVNIRSAFMLCQHYVPGMVARGGGTITFTSTIHSIAALPVFMSYASSKGAINAMARSLAKEYGAKGVRVNVVAPGGVASSMWEEMRSGMTQEQVEMSAYNSIDPMGSIAQCRDIAHAHLFFASDMSRGVTGQALLVDSGANAFLRGMDTFDYPDTYPLSRRLPYLGRGGYEQKEDGNTMNLYESLGVKTYINAWDTMSIIGGSRMQQNTLDAMREASHDFVELKDLQRKVGARVAQMTKNEAAYITAGASSGILYSCAVCMADGAQHPDRYAQLPDTTGMKDEIVVMKGHRNSYDFAIKVSGATLVEAGQEESCSAQELIDAFTEKTAAVLYFDTDHFEARGLPLKDVVRIAHERGIYVVVDGAAQLPPLENLWHYTRDCGADLAVFSGGKGLRGPQQGGVAVGKEHLIEGFYLVAAPNQGVGRSSKVGREEIVGVYTALKTFLEPGYVAQKQKYLADASRNIIARLNETGLFTCEVIVPGPTGQTYDWVLANIVPEKITGAMIADALKAGEPGIMVGERERAITVNPLNLEPDEVEVVIRAIIKETKALLQA